MDLPVDFVKEINSYASPSLEGLIDAIKSTTPSVSIRVNKYKEVLAKEYPEFSNINISLPDESNRRVGQSIAAASLPANV